MLAVAEVGIAALMGNDRRVIQLAAKRLHPEPEPIKMPETDLAAKAIASAGHAAHPAGSAVSDAFTLGAFAITGAGQYAEQATALLVSIAVGLGMLALIGGLSQLNARGPAASQADARPEFGMSWRPPSRVPLD